MNTLLIVSGGIEVVPAIQHAKKMGLYVIVSDGNPNAPGIKFADDFILASTYDVNDTVEKVKKYDKNIKKINGVICIAADIPFTVSSVANELGLQSISIESSILSMDKILMKDKFFEDNIPIPHYSEIHDLTDLRDFINKYAFPIVLKPADNCGSRGVLFITEKIDLEWAFSYSKKYSNSGRVLVEKFLEGPQISTESLIIDSSCKTVGFSDRNYEFLEKYAPHIIENGGDLPSKISKVLQKKTKKLISEAAISMGIKNGVVKGDVVIFNNEPYIIEIAARLSGGYFSTHTIPLNTGVDFVGNAINLCLGKKLIMKDLQQKFNNYICQRYIFAKKGIVDSIQGIQSLKDNNAIKFFNLHIKSGQKINALTSHGARVGMVIAKGSSRQTAINNAISAVNDIKISYQD
jgi:biotin carboxylase